MNTRLDIELTNPKVTYRDPASKRKIKATDTVPATSFHRRRAADGDSKILREYEISAGPPVKSAADHRAAVKAAARKAAAERLNKVAEGHADDSAAARVEKAAAPKPPATPVKKPK